MNNQEREIISDIFQRMEQAAGQPRDPEAERLIADRIRQQPYAPYAMAQTIYVQEQALTSLQAQLQDLQAEVEELRRRPAPGGFLSGLFGGGSRRPEPPRRSSFSQPATGMQQPGYGQGGYGQGGYGQGGFGQPGMGMQPGPAGSPWGGQPRAGGGFLGTALTTAAGVAGGMMLANALSSAFQGGHQTLGSLGADGLASGAASDSGLGGISDALHQGGDASFQNAGFSDGADLGGGADFGDAGGGDFDMGGDDY